MGFRDNLSIWIVCLGIIILGALTLVLQNSDFDGPPHSGSYFITDLRFIPSKAIVLPDSHLGLDDMMYEELNRTEFVMSVQVLHTNVSWTQGYRYKLQDGNDTFVRDADNRTPMFFSDWSYGLTYTCSIRFLCNSTDERILGLPILAEDRYFQGSFSFIKGRNDKIKFFDENNPLYENNRHTYVIYYGNVKEQGLLDDYVLYIEMEEIGIADAA